MSEPRLPFDDDGPIPIASRQARPIDSRPREAAAVDPGRTAVLESGDRATTEAARDTPPIDAPAREAAVDPGRNVVLEASAGTGKTRVLVDRYVNLLRAGVDPDHILAITFTRKAAAEMRERIIERLREASRLSAVDLARWRDLKDRLGDIAISTIDAFCLSLLREFPLEADVDPAFDLADDTEVPRLVGESLDQAFRICRAIAKEDDDVALVFAQLGERRLRIGIAALLDRRLVAPQALRRFLARGPRDLTAETACRDAAATAARRPDAGLGRAGFVPGRRTVAHPHFAMLAADLRAARRRSRPAVPRAPGEGRAAFRVLVDRLRGYFLTQDGRRARQGLCRHRLQGRTLRQRRRLAAPPPGGGGDRAGHRRSAARIPTRSERDPVARRLADFRGGAAAVSGQSRGALAARFLRRARTRGEAAEGDGRVRPQPVPARVALPACARRRVSGHQPRAVGAGRAAGAQLGRRVGRRRRRARALDLHRRRSEAVDLRVPRRGRRRAGRSGVVHSRAAARRRSVAGDFGQNADPRTTVRLLGENINADWREQVERVPMRGCTVKISVALNELPNFVARPGVE